MMPMIPALIIQRLVEIRAQQAKRQLIMPHGKSPIDGKKTPEAALNFMRPVPAGMMN